MDLSIPGSTTNLPLTPVFGDNVQDLLNAGALNVNPSAIITVNSLADALDDPNSGVTTLRDAINQANGDTGSDLIVFDRSLFSNAQTITLSQGELDSTHNLDIIAPRDSLTGADLVTVSGNNASRVLEIETGATVNLSGLIVADGSVLGDSGGGIKNFGTLTLDSSIVSNNSTTRLYNSIGDGGGIYTSGNLTVTNSTISGNSAPYGGGISSSGISKLSNITVNNSIISGNSAGYDGGGIDASSTGNVISNSIISGNSAGNNGGGIYNFILNDVPVVTNCIIMGNSAGSEGGGIYNSQGSNGVISNSIISGNSAGSEGGGIFNLGNTAGSNGIVFNLDNPTNLTLNVSNSTISDNSAGSNGGGISNFGGIVNVSNSALIGNTAQNDGGGVYNIVNRFRQSEGANSFTTAQSVVNVSNSTLIGNTAQNDGGAAYNNSILILAFSTLTLNQATNSGGVFNGIFMFNNTDGSTSVRNTIIAANLLNENGINPDVSGIFTSNGYNLIGDGTGSTGFGSPGDIVGSDNPIDPRLAPLDFNGGPTQTIALLPDSPAIDAGDPTVLNTDPTTDQRGLPRRAGDGSADIGAFEFSS